MSGFAQDCPSLAGTRAEQSQRGSTNRRCKSHPTKKQCAAVRVLPEWFLSPLSILEAPLEHKAARVRMRSTLNVVHSTSPGQAAAPALMPAPCSTAGENTAPVPTSCPPSHPVPATGTLVWLWPHTMHTPFLSVASGLVVMQNMFLRRVCAKAEVLRRQRPHGFP